MPAALQAAVRLLEARPRSRAALVRLLENKGYPATLAAAAAARCEELGYLRERDLARSLARSLLAAGHAPEAVLARLLARDLEERDARAALAAEVEESGWSAPDAARALLKKKKLAGPKAVRFLLSRGFGEAVARRAAGFDEE